MKWRGVECKAVNVMVPTEHYDVLHQLAQVRQCSVDELLFTFYEHGVTNFFQENKLTIEEVNVAAAYEKAKARIDSWRRRY